MSYPTHVFPTKHRREKGRVLRKIKHSGYQPLLLSIFTHYNYSLWHHSHICNVDVVKTSLSSLEGRVYLLHQFYDDFMRLYETLGVKDGLVSSIDATVAKAISMINNIVQESKMYSLEVNKIESALTEKYTELHLKVFRLYEDNIMNKNKKVNISNNEIVLENMMVKHMDTVHARLGWHFCEGCSMGVLIRACVYEVIQDIWRTLDDISTEDSNATSVI